jgi:hypothetical protein
MTRNLRIGLIGGATLLALFALETGSGEDAVAPDGRYSGPGSTQGMYSEEGGGQEGWYAEEGGYDAQGGYPQDGYSQGGAYSGGGSDGGSGGDYSGGGYPGGGYSGGSYPGGYTGAQTMNEVGDMQMQGWQAQQASSDEMHRQTINGINGTADVYDAQAGETHYGVEGGSGAYWANPTTGAVVGTDTYADNPDASSYNATTNLDDM